MNQSAIVVRYRQPDWWLLSIVLVLLIMGLAMVFSSSGVRAAREYNDAYYFFQKQAIFVTFGLVVMLIVSVLPRKFLHSIHYAAIFAVVVLLIATISPLGVSVNGARRWLPLGFLRFQVVEFAKIALVFYLAYFMSSKQDIIKTFNKGVIPPFAITGLMCALLLLQPDFGGMATLAIILFCMCLAGGTRFIYLFLSAAMGVGLGLILIMNSPYRMRRLLGFLNPIENAQGDGYHIVQSLIAIGSGGSTGVGLGASRQKLYFLPEAHTDFIMAIFAEETGFLGMSIFFILVGLLFWRGMFIALRQDDLRDRLIVFGVLIILMLSFAINMAVVTSSAPVTGVPMPFLSYGGSSLIATMVCVGLLLNFSRTGKV